MTPMYTARDIRDWKADSAFPIDQVKCFTADTFAEAKRKATERTEPGGHSARGRASERRITWRHSRP